MRKSVVLDRQDRVFIVSVTGVDMLLDVRI